MASSTRRADATAAGLLVDAPPDRPGRHTGDDGVGGDILGHNRARGDHRAGADGDAGQHDRAVTEPDIVAEPDLVLAPPVEEVRVVVVGEPVVDRTVGEVVQGRAPHRVVGRVDPRIGGDVAELADLGTPRDAALHDVGVVAQRGFVKAGLRADLDVGAELAVPHVRGRVDDGSLAEPVHAPEGNRALAHPVGARFAMRERAGKSPVSDLPARATGVKPRCNRTT